MRNIDGKGTMRYRAGLLISTVNGGVKIGPFFGLLDLGANNTMKVTLDSVLLTGTVTLTLKKVFPATARIKHPLPQINVTGTFTGILTGTTSIDDVNPKEPKP